MSSSASSKDSGVDPIAVEVAGQLKALRDGAAGRPAEEQARYLESELRALIQSLPAAQQRDLLASMEGRGARAPDGSAAVDGAPAVRTPARGSTTPASSRTVALEAIIGPVAAELNVSPDAVDARQCGRLLASLVKLVVGLDERIVRGLLAELNASTGDNAGSSVAGGDSLASTITSLITQPAEADLSKLNAHLDRIPRMLGAFATAASSPGRFTWEIVQQRLRPDYIVLKAGSGAKKERVLWQLYEREFAALSVPEIEQEAKPHVHQFLKSWLDDTDPINHGGSGH